ncbi:ABC transporter ATP-binding protein [Marinobacter sp. OP 3.4]|uniref:ABC transporter ATP-binding protein n=1 Tax=Marinobacter sp. OP 3.4 TaxID=3076501 RepID=UPI002E24790F
MTSVSVSGLRKTYDAGTGPVTVFTGLSLELPPGESLALTGPSGSGKSTLMNILCGLESIDAGDVQVLGKSATALSTDQWAELRRRRIGVVFQDSNLMPAMTLAENIRLRADLAGRSFGPVNDWLERLGLAGLGDRYPDQVSGGQRQRAALAMVFAMGPDLVLADEPTGSLDRHTATQVSDALFHWQRQQGCGLILASHDLALAGRCDHRLDLAAEGRP